MAAPGDPAPPRADVDTVAPDAASGRLDTAAVGAMFDHIARRYDLLNTLLSAGLDRRWRRLALDASGVGPGDTAVDLCTGTGALARGLRHRVGRTGTVIGVDVSSGMLAAARCRVPGVDFRHGDATDLAGVADGSVDAVTVAFGLRNIGDRAAALREAARVLRPGGRLVILELGQVEHRWLGRLHAWYLEHLLPRIGRAVSGDAQAYTYLPASIARYPGAETVSGWLADAGLAPVAVRRLTLGTVTLHVGVRPTTPTARGE